MNNTQALLQPNACLGKRQFYPTSDKSQNIGVNILVIQDLAAIAFQWGVVVTSWPEIEARGVHWTSGSACEIYAHSRR
jgi:hypothetical protein